MRFYEDYVLLRDFALGLERDLFEIYYLLIRGLVRGDFNSWSYLKVLLP